MTKSKNKTITILFLVCFIELGIYLWSVWTSTFNMTNFFAIKPEFIFDKCARLAGRISALILLIELIMVGYYGLKKIYSSEKIRENFISINTMFCFNHLIHLLFVFQLFKYHGKSLNFDKPLEIGGAFHGLVSFAFIFIIPFLLWKQKEINGFLYLCIVLYLINTSIFMIKTFLSKIKLPETPAYHNQLGIVLLTSACLLVFYRVYIEQKKSV